MSGELLSEARFKELAAEGYNRIPLARELLADLDTPLSCYLKLANGAFSFLLESVQGGETWGRYSIIGLPCNTVLTVRGHSIEIRENGAVTEQLTSAAPMEFVRKFQQRYTVPKASSMAAFEGGLAGYIAYDTVRFAEPRLLHNPETLSNKPDPLGNPDIVLLVAEELVVFDNLSGTLKLIVHCDPSQPGAYQLGLARLSELEQSLREQELAVAGIDLAALHQGNDGVPQEFTLGIERNDFECKVKQIREYIAAGDCMQVVLSQRLSAPFAGQGTDLYRALRLLNPSPYMYYFNLDELEIVGSSPEILARLQNGRATVRPIAGTRPRGLNAEEDQRLQADLMADPKELAEHLMLIDLGRNDIGRIAQTGSVTVDEQMQVDYYSHVMHIVSRVSGQLRDELTALDVLQACLPAGTLSGAPKIRAMEIIDELEPHKRGIYGGAIGYISWHGEMDTAIAIRTALLQDGAIHLQAGAGIVADSVPALEWQECMNKAGALFKAVQLCC